MVALNLKLETVDMDEEDSGDFMFVKTDWSKCSFQCNKQIHSTSSMIDSDDDQDELTVTSASPREGRKWDNAVGKSNSPAKMRKGPLLNKEMHRNKSSIDSWCKRAQQSKAAKRNCSVQRSSENGSTSEKNRIKRNRKLTTTTSSLNCSDNKKKGLKCSGCSIVFSADEELLQHYSESESCKQAGNLSGKRSMNQKVVTTGVVVLCIACHKTFSSDLALAQHLQKSQSCLSFKVPVSDPDMEHRCTECRKCFRGDKQLAAHLQKNGICQKASEVGENMITRSDQSVEETDSSSFQVVTETKTHSHLIENSNDPVANTTLSISHAVQNVEQSSNGSNMKEAQPFESYNGHSESCEEVETNFSSSDDSYLKISSSSSEEENAEFKRKLYSGTGRRKDCGKHVKTHRRHPEDKRKNKDKAMYCKACSKEVDDKTALTAHLLENRDCFLALTRMFWFKKEGKCTMCGKVFGDYKCLRKHCFKDLTCRLRYIELELQKGKTSTQIELPQLAEADKMLSQKLNESGEGKNTLNELSQSVEHEDEDDCIEVGALKRVTSVTECGNKETGSFPLHTCGNCGFRGCVSKHVFSNQICLDFYEQHGNKQPFSLPFCFTCKSRFKSQPLLEQHKCPGFRPYTHSCKSCGRKFSNEASLKRHSVIHTNKKCNAEADDSGEFNSTGDKTANSVGSEVVQQEKSSMSMLEEKYDGVSSSTLYKCHLCSGQFPTFHLLTEHSRQHVDAISKAKHTCFICKQSFGSFVIFKAHIATHPGFSDNCDSVCSENLPSRSELDKNEKQMSSAGTSMQLNNQSEYLLLRIKDPEDSGIFNAKESSTVCSCCQKKFTSQREKRKHLAVSSRCKRTLSSVAATSIVMTSTSPSVSGTQPMVGEKELSRPQLVSRSSSDQKVVCLYCYQEFPTEQEKVNHIMASTACKSIMQWILDNKFYVTVQDSNISSEKHFVHPSTCEFCHFSFPDKLSHLLESQCRKSLEKGILKYRGNPSETQTFEENNSANAVGALVAPALKKNDKTDDQMRTSDIFRREKDIFQSLSKSIPTNEIVTNNKEKLQGHAAADRSMVMPTVQKSSTRRSCNLCGKSFLYLCNFKQHFKIAHSKTNVKRLPPEKAAGVTECSDHSPNFYHRLEKSLLTCSFSQFDSPNAKRLHEHRIECEKLCTCRICHRKHRSLVALKGHVVFFHRQAWAKYERNAFSVHEKRFVEASLNQQHLRSQCKPCKVVLERIHVS